MSDRTDSTDAPLALRTESPYGDTPGDDVACSDCGNYRTLIGPLDFDGTLSETGDMVCRPCAETRGWSE